MPARPADDDTLLVFSRGAAGADEGVDAASVRQLHLDVAFPVLHGPYGEDGTIQGLFELANIPYVGAGVLASAVGMDKAVMKVLFARGRPADAGVRHDDAGARMEGQPGCRAPAHRRPASRCPVFVKPANLGSSVGISKAKDDGGARPRPSTSPPSSIARSSSRRRCPTRARSRSRSSATTHPEASVPGRDHPGRGVRVLRLRRQVHEGVGPHRPGAADGRADRRGTAPGGGGIPGDRRRGHGPRRLPLRSRGGDVVRERDQHDPGFTTISMYPKLWEASGIGYGALLDRLIALGLERHAEKQRLRTSEP